MSKEMDGYIDLTWPIQDLKERPVVMKDSFMKALNTLSDQCITGRIAMVNLNQSRGVMVTLEELDILDEDDTLLLDGKIDYTELED